ncbi:MAG: hypothetical protein ACKO96_19315, partial [Flammeovirgaceae bacterium]
WNVNINPEDDGYPKDFDYFVFRQEVHFRDNIFPTSRWFRDMEVHKPFIMNGSAFKQSSYFSGSHFKKHASFLKVKVETDVPSCRGVTCEKYFDFEADDEHFPKV